ncbi:MAG: DNA primase [Oscillospiraceae bacterium]|nr:DNA primase [Oscillospiraceae bacterium]
MALSPEFQAFLDELCASNDISSVAAERGISVKRSGNSYSCCCPFHAEKTPSCHLYTEDNHFHCFGCGAHGNVIKFVMQAENTDFMNAVEILSNRVGMTIPRGNGRANGKVNFKPKSGYNKPDDHSRDTSPAYSAGTSSADYSDKSAEPAVYPTYEEAPPTAEDYYAQYEDSGYSRKKRIYEINQAAGSFFHKQLFSPEGKAGLDYFTERGLSVETIKRFGLGYAADDYHKLHYYMRGLGYTDAELKEAALIATRNGREFYDKFRNRVMFPVFDEQRRVIAFGGRILTDEKKAPKYLNSDETPVFQKRKTLFALNYAKRSKADHFIICEGYMDVIAMHQAGFDSAVASLGTAITSEQAQLLSKRGKSKVVLSYDSDAAGQKATSKAIGLFMQTSVEKVSVLKISEAKDPDEFIKKYGAEPFKMLIENSVGAVAFEMERLSGGLDMNNPDDKNVFIRRSVRFMSEIEDPAFRELCVEKAAALGDVSKKSVLDGVNDLISRKAPYARMKASSESRAVDYSGYDGGSDRGGKSLSGEENAETAVLSYLFHNPDDIQKIEERLSGGLVTEFGEQAYRLLLEKIRESSGECEISWLNEKFPEEMGRITEIVNDTIFAYSEECFIEAASKLSGIKRSVESVNTFAELGDYIQYKQEKESID